MKMWWFWFGISFYTKSNINTNKLMKMCNWFFFLWMKHVSGLKFFIVNKYTFDDFFVYWFLVFARFINWWFCCVKIVYSWICIVGFIRRKTLHDKQKIKKNRFGSNNVYEYWNKCVRVNSDKLAQWEWKTMAPLYFICWTKKWKEKAILN